MKKRRILISKTAMEKMKDLTVKYDGTENGGFIFGRMNPEWIQVLDISDAGFNAKRTFSSVQLDNNSLIEFVKDKIKMQQYLIGTWHSHPKEFGLNPSKLDESTMNKINDYFDSTHAPIFIITNIINESFNFVIYRVGKFGTVIKDMNYELIDCEG